MLKGSSDGVMSCTETMIKKMVTRIIWYREEHCKRTFPSLMSKTIAVILSHTLGKHCQVFFQMLCSLILLVS